MTIAPEATPPLPPPSRSESAPRPVPGGGFIVALLAGLAISGSILLLFIPPLGVAWAVIAGILAGATVRQARHVITVTLASVALPVVTSFLATCLTGVWGWLVVGIFVAAVLLLVATPIAFGIGRLVRPRIGRAYPVLVATLVVGGVLGALGWSLAMADAVAPASCPPGIQAVEL